MGGIFPDFLQGPENFTKKKNIPAFQVAILSFPFTYLFNRSSATKSKKRGRIFLDYPQEAGHFFKILTAAFRRVILSFFFKYVYINAYQQHRPNKRKGRIFPRLLWDRKLFFFNPRSSISKGNFFLFFHLFIQTSISITSHIREETNLSQGILKDQDTKKNK